MFIYLNISTVDPKFAQNGFVKSQSAQCSEGLSSLVKLAFLAFILNVWQFTGEFSPVRGLSKTALLPEDEEQVYHKTPGGYQLDEFMRAKEYFMKASTQTGISL